MNSPDLDLPHWPSAMARSIPPRPSTFGFDAVPLERTLSFMSRAHHTLVIAAAIAAVTAAGLAGGSASAMSRPAEQTATVSSMRQSWRPRPTPSPRPTATPTATPTPAPSSPAATGTACAFPTVSFNGAAYCPATIDAVRATFYGTGTRVVLRGVTVTAVTTSTVTVAAWASPPCPPGKFCGQLMTLQSLTVSWSGTSRPAHGDVLDLFGPTIPTSITPVGSVTTGYCPIDWC